uniref:Uncharacterized protein n=1 Tax=viral metagenome TaxID=1070528 RepID=A0A6C0BEK6_9ZZZZ
MRNNEIGIIKLFSLKSWSYFELLNIFLLSYL